MRRLRWTPKAGDDLARLYEFLAPVNPQAAARAVQALVAAPETLLAFPRLGQRLTAYDPREVRRLIVRDYEIRYEVEDDTIHVLRIWHGREDR